MRAGSLLTSVLAATLFVVSGSAIAKTPPRYGAVVYSNLCTDPDSGDIGGTRITLLRFSDGDRVIYEVTDGAVMWPVYAARAKVDAKTGTISFEVKTDTGTATFAGKFSDSALTGALSGKAESVRLPRITNLGRSMPNCP